MCSLRTRTDSPAPGCLPGVQVRGRVRLETGLPSEGCPPRPCPPRPWRRLYTSWVFRIAERGRGGEQRLNQVSLPILIPARFPPEELSPDLVTAISLRLKQWIKGDSARAGVRLGLVGRAVVTAVGAPGSAPLGLGALAQPLSRLRTHNFPGIETEAPLRGLDLGALR